MGIFPKIQWANMAGNHIQVIFWLLLNYNQFQFNIFQPRFPFKFCAYRSTNWQKNPQRRNFKMSKYTISYWSMA